MVCGVVGDIVYSTSTEDYTDTSCASLTWATSTKLYHSGSTCVETAGTVTYTNANNEIYTDSSCDLISTLLSLEALTNNNGVCEVESSSSTTIGIAVGVSVGGVVIIVTGIIAGVLIKKKNLKKLQLSQGTQLQEAKTQEGTLAVDEGGKKDKKALKPFSSG